MRKIVMIMSILLVGILADAEGRSELEKRSDEIIMNNGDWFPSEAFVNNSLADMDGDNEYELKLSLISKGRSFVAVKAAENGRETDLEHPDIDKIVREEMEFFNSVYYLTSCKDLKGVSVSEEFKCSENDTCMIIKGGCGYESLDLRFEMEVRSSDGVILSYIVTTAKPFKDEGGVDIINFKSVVTFNADKDNWYPVKRVDESVIEVSRFLLGKWRGINKVETEYKNYKKAAVQ